MTNAQLSLLIAALLACAALLRSWAPSTAVAARRNRRLFWVAAIRVLLPLGLFALAVSALWLLDDGWLSEPASGPTEIVVVAGLAVTGGVVSYRLSGLLQRRRRG